MSRLCSSLLLSLLIASEASAVTMEWVTIGDPGNAADTAVMNDNTTGYGSVAYAYRISKYEVTNAQYTEFLNAVAVGTEYGLYNANMSSSPYGGITQSGSAGSFSYSVKDGFETKPVNFVSFEDAAYFANWLNNGQPVLDPSYPAGEPAPRGVGSGAYNIYSQPTSYSRSPTATIFLPSEDEWYKAAYYDPSSSSYFIWPTGTNAFPSCGAPAGAANTANCSADSHGGTGPLSPTAVGSYPGSPSPYGTFDQGGNVLEWNEGDDLDHRGLRAGSFDQGYGSMVSEDRGLLGDGDLEVASIGFRVAAVVPEPSTGLLVIAGLLSFAGWRRVSASLELHDSTD